jgi:selenocysteine-specific elongation factor
MPREEVKSRLARYLPAQTSKSFNEIVARATHEGWLAESAWGLHLLDHRVEFTPVQQQSVDSLLRTFARSPYSTPSVSQCEEQVGSEVFAALVEQGTLVKLSDDVVLMASTYDEMRDRLVAYLQENQSITVAQVRDLFGTSRKYALAFVGYLDEKRLTRRVGDERVLR